MRRSTVAALCVLVLGLVARLVYFFQETSLWGDPAALGLIAKHISEGREFSPYLWLAHYSGTLSAWITAVWFKAFGVSARVYALTGLLFSCAQVLLIWLLAGRVLGRAGALICLALVALPPFQTLDLMFLYQYGDSLALGCGVLLVVVAFAREPDLDLPGGTLIAGLLSGLGLWTSPLFVPLLATEAFVFWRRGPARWKRDFSRWLPGFLAGYLPAIVYNFRHPGAQFQRMAGRFFDIDRAEWTASRGRGLLLAMKGLAKAGRIPLAIARLPAQFAAITNWLDCVAVVAAAVWAFRRLRRRDPADRPLAVLALYLLCFLVYEVILVGEPPARLTFPLYLPFVILAAGALADLWRKARAAAALTLAVVLAGHGWSLARGFINPGTMSVAELVDFLSSRGISDGYADYWVSYPVIFQSNEKILVSPTLLHPTFDDRYPEYTRRVRAAPQAAFILDNARNYCVAPLIEQELLKERVSYQKSLVKGFTVYYGFSRKIYPEVFHIEDHLADRFYCPPRS